ncbi:MAG: hypothetical protein HOH43_16225 [Candidatus Latescibacteria bacterium]|nr:hypothetical protein [Candidatus Latescibacterota bacterium]
MYIISEQGSERATSDNGKIITFQGRTHVTWQDVTREGYFNRVNTFDHATSEWKDPVTLNVGVDNHARSVLAVDPDGILHAILGGHATEVQWCHTLSPNETSSWTDPVPVGVGTYPALFGGPDGTLYLAMRGQGPERHDRGLDLYHRPPGGSWSSPLRLVTLAEEYGQAYAGFNTQMDVSPGGALHATVDFYEGEDEAGRGLHQASCYVHSPDGGITWKRANGTGVTLPARPEDLDILARTTRSRHELLPPAEIYGVGMVVDSMEHPFAFYMDHGVGPGHCVMVTPGKDGQLIGTPISHYWEHAYPDMRATECRTTIREDDSICLLVTLTPFDDEWHDGKPTRFMSMRERRDIRMVWLLSEDRGASFHVQPFLEPGRSYNVPSLERTRGANVVPADRLPAVVYFDGSRAYPGGGDYYDETVTVAEMLASGGFRTNNVILDGLTPSNPYGDEATWFRAVPQRLHDHPSMAWVPEDSELPSVLLLGDSISMSYTLGVRNLLRGTAQVFRAPDNCRSTRQTVECLELWLANQDWTVIHINCGIHDITLMNDELVADATGRCQIPADHYRANLTRIFGRLDETKAQIIWATTTPVGDHVPIRKNTDIDAYNVIADELISGRKVQVDDLHTAVKSHETSLWSDGVHFTEEGAELLARQAAEAVRLALP